ncbi:hypothetical protein [Cohnella yongneupensis]|uniref:Uncharacterized protein n=1 Tax=Cohnella yongneupensis TaxID=425006 RepID=A0ABW0R249_9BACL
MNKMKPYVLSLLAVLLLATLFFVPSEADAAGTSRYKFTLKNAAGKAYSVALASDKESKRSVEDPSAFGNEGDTIYSGVYYLTVQGKKQKITVNGNKPFDINPSQSDIYVVPTVGKGTPDLLIVGQRESSNFYSFEAFAIANDGTAKRVGFIRQGSSKVSYAMYSSYKMKNYTALKFQTVDYDNAEFAGWYFTSYTLNAASLVMTAKSTIFYGDGNPDDVKKYGDWNTGEKQINRYKNEARFAVVETPAATSTTKTLKFALDKNTAANLKAGIVPGTGVKLGSTRATITKTLGKPSSRENEFGSSEWTFPKLPHSFFIFGFDSNHPDALSLAVLGVSDLPKMKFSDVQRLLGKSVIEESEEESGYTLSYTYNNDTIAITFSADSPTGYVYEVYMRKY